MEGEEPKEFSRCGDLDFGGGSFRAGGDGVAGLRPYAGSWRHVFLFSPVKGVFPSSKLCV